MAILAASALVGQPPVAQPITGSPQIAVLLPLSGDFGHIGEQLLESLTLALEDRPGATWTVIDSEGSPATSAARVGELAQNPANVAIVGPVGARESRAAAEVAARAGIPLLTLTSDEGIEHIGRSVMRMRVSPDEQARFMARLAIADLGLQRVAVLYPDDHFGRSAARAFVAEVLALHGRATAIEAYEPGETNVNDEISLLAAQRVRRLRGHSWDDPPAVRARHRASVSNVDFQAIFLPDDRQRVDALLAFLAFWDVPVGDGVQVLGTSSWLGTSPALEGPAAEGALFSLVFHPNVYERRASRWASRFLERFGRAPTEADAQAYDALSLLLDALLTRQPAGGWTRTALRDTLLLAAPFDGLTGPVSLSESGAVERRLELFSVGRGGWIGPYTILR